MRKNKVLILSLIILAIPFILFIYINIFIKVSKLKTEKIVVEFKEKFLEQRLEIASDNILNLVKMEIDGNDYIGVVNVVSDNLLLPVESKCNNSFLNIKGACNYSNNSLVILGTNLNNSFSSFKQYNIGDEISFTNTLGWTFRYKIEKIKRFNKLDSLLQYDDDLIIVIKNYYGMEYVFLLCEAY